MASNPTDAIDRTFPRREWFAGLGRLSLVLAIAHGALVALLLLEGGLIVGLLIDRGMLSTHVSLADAARFEQLTGLPLQVTDQPPLDAADAAPAKRQPVQAAPAANEQTDPQDTAPPAVGVPPIDASGAGETVPPTPAEDSSAPQGVAAGGTAPAAPPPVPPPGAPQLAAGASTHVALHFEDHGILPTVWRSRNNWWGGLLAAAFRQFPQLQQNVASLMILLGVFAVTWLARVWCAAQLRRACRGAALEVSTRLRRQLHRQSMRLATEDVDGHGMTEAVTLFRKDVDRVRAGLYEWLYRGMRYPWELVFLILAAFSVEILLAVQWVLLSVLGWYLIARSQRQAERTRELAQDRAERELGSLADSLLAAKLIRGYGLDGTEQGQFQERLERYVTAVDVQNRVQDDPLWLRLAVSLACVALASFLFFVLGVKTLSQEVSAPGAAVFLAAFAAGLVAVREIGRLPLHRREVSLAAHKVWRYLDVLPNVSQAVGARFLQPLSTSLHIVDVSYRLPHGRTLLDRVDLQLTAGRSYAVVSLNRLEARAFGYLLPRFIEPQSGRILFDGEDIAWGTLESIRAETLFVSASDPFLPGSVLDNIRAGQTAITLTQATEAAKEARAHSFLSRLSQGYETILDGQESLLDVGQRLRLSLARALLRKPAILIIEEPVTGLDDDTKQLLDDTYDRICPGRTVFFLPGRLSTVRRTDDIIVLRGGRVEAMGPHSLLVAESPLYRHWEYLHFHEFRHDDADGKAATK